MVASPAVVNPSVVLRHRGNRAPPAASAPSGTRLTGPIGPLSPRLHDVA